jgi:chromosomal replication initiator protein
MYCSPNIVPLKTRILLPEDIIQQGADFFRIKLTDLISKCRERKLVETRQMLIDMLYSDEYMRLSLKDIARLFGNRDHSTMIYSIRQVANLCQTDFIFRERYKRFHLLIYGNLDNFRR